MRASDAEVLVVGGGPAGAATTALLAQRGHDVLVLEKARFPREKPCGEYFSPGVVEVLARLGVLGAVRASGAAWPPGIRIQTPGPGFVLTYSGLTMGEGGQRTALGIPRSVLDQLLLDHARSRGARVREGVRVLGAAVKGGQVIGVRVLGPAGEEVLRARFVVAADGRHSAVARSLGLHRPVRWPHRLGLVARFAGVAVSDDLAEMHVGRGVYCGVAPLGDGLINIGLVVPLDGRGRGESIEQLFERRLAELPGVPRRLKGARRLTPIRGVGPLARRVCRIAGPGYLLVGDAAGFLDPLTGEGVFRALRGAELAADGVEMALRRGDGIPAGYAAAHRDTFGDKERVCLLIQLFLSQPRAFEYAVGRLERRPQLVGLLSGVLGDCAPAAPALRPSYLWSLLRP